MEETLIEGRASGDLRCDCPAGCYPTVDTLLTLIRIPPPLNDGKSDQFEIIMQLLGNFRDFEIAKGGPFAFLQLLGILKFP